MKLSRPTTLMIPLAGLLLVIAAGAVLATQGEPGRATAAIPAAATPTPAPSTGAAGKAVGGTLLAGVLDDLVTKGTITGAQKQAILDGLTAKRDALKAQRKAAMAQQQADRKQIRDFLSDGVITKDEFDKLPADSPYRKMSGLMDDGKITLDELKQLGRDMFGGMRGGHGMKGFFGGKGWGPAASPSASPSTGG